MVNYKNSKIFIITEKDTGLVYIGGALIYVFRIPERHFPIRFDLIGASH